MPRRPYVPSERHRQAPRSLLSPEPGFYRTRLAKGGPLVAAEIRHAPTPDPETGTPLDRSWMWSALVNGEPVGDPEPRPSATVWNIHEAGDRIDRETHDLMCRQAAWDAQYQPDAPGANPRKRIDPMTTPLPF